MWKDLLWGGNLSYTVIWKHNNHFNLAECKLNWVGCLTIIPQNTSPYLGTLCSWLLNNRGLKWVQVRLYAFFIVNITTLHGLQLFESEDAEQWIWRNGIYQGPTMSCKLYMDFWLHRVWVPLALKLFKDQLYYYSQFYRWRNQRSEKLGNWPIEVPLIIWLMTIEIKVHTFPIHYNCIDF